MKTYFDELVGIDIYYLLKRDRKKV